MLGAQHRCMIPAIFPVPALTVAVNVRRYPSNTHTTRCLLSSHIQIPETKDSATTVTVAIAIPAPDHAVTSSLQAIHLCSLCMVLSDVTNFTSPQLFSPELRNRYHQGFRMCGRQIIVTENVRVPCCIAPHRGRHGTIRRYEFTILDTNAVYIPHIDNQPMEQTT